MSSNGGRKLGVFKWFGGCVSCFKPEQDEQHDTSTGGGGDVASSSSSSGIINLTVPDNDNPALWKYFDIGRHGGQDYSWAIVQGEPIRSSLSNIRVELLAKGIIFLGLYAGHGSSNLCAIYAHENLFKILINIETKNTTIEDDLRQAFFRTEEQWLQIVFNKFEGDRLIAAAGSSSLVGLIGQDHICLAHVGDSRALIGDIGEDNITIPFTLMKEDNVNDPTVRAELLIDHPEPDFMTQNSDGVYSIKGQSQISKSIGDGYLKRSELNLDDIPEYRLNSPLTTNALSATPFIKATDIANSQQFLVFASKELWDIIPNSEVVLFVQMNPRKGIAATLIRHALNMVATRNNLTYSELQKASDGSYIYYNDISAAVVFFEETGTVTFIEEAQQGAVKEIGSSSTGTNYFTGLKELKSEDSDDVGMPALEDEPPALPWRLPGGLGFSLLFPFVFLACIFVLPTWLFYYDF